MGWDFLLQHSAKRLRSDFMTADEDEIDATHEVDDSGEKVTVDLDVERPPHDWAPVSVLERTGATDLLPARFVDGCHRGRTVVWIQDARGRPVPIMLAEIGGIALRRAGRELQREYACVERVVTMMIDSFPWAEVESFAAALRGSGLRLLPARPPKDEQTQRRELSHDFELLRRRTQNRSQYELETLEELALSRDPHTPTVLDGCIEPKSSGLPRLDLPVVGVVKRPREPYLHAAGWRTLYGLRPTDRTPVFRIHGTKLTVLTWYLRLATADDGEPGFGIVRVEVTEPFWNTLPDPLAHVDALSAWLYEHRCHRQGYDRAAISLDPIVQAETSLRSLFSPEDHLRNWFYRRTGL